MRFPLLLRLTRQPRATRAARRPTLPVATVDRLELERWRAGACHRTLLSRLRKIRCRHREVNRGCYGLRCRRCGRWWAWGQPHPA